MNTRSRQSFITAIATSFGFAVHFTAPLSAGDSTPLNPPAQEAAISDQSLLDSLSFSDANLGGFLFPHFHALGAFGDTTGNQESLAQGHHDPQTDATLQALHPGMSLRAGMLQGFATANGYTDAHGHFNFVLEEGFLKLVDLPLGIQLRGGQFYNRFGFQNSLHNHGWMFVDQNLVNGRFLNEGELGTIGGEVSIDVPLSMMQASVLSVAVGGLPSHGHGHDHGHEHGDHEEAEFEAEGANFTNTLVTAAWVNQYDINDMNRITGIFSGAWGDNEFGRTTQVYGVGFEYLWRENGYGAGGQSVRWRNELMYRDLGGVSGHLHEEEEHDEHGHADEDEEEHDHHEEEHEHDEERRYASFDEFGLYSTMIYGLNEHWEAGARAGWVSGISEMGLDDRFRLSPMITWYANSARTLQARLQYNWDHSDDFGSEHSVWFQVGLNFGGPEVR
ncbi:MAG: hypothetical protein KDN20_21935 [Verrucomicrobiae bacterium]|nr:hypothetical protein [Verrucomicrobiae bacterium]